MFEYITEIHMKDGTVVTAKNPQVKEFEDNIFKVIKEESYEILIPRENIRLIRTTREVKEDYYK